MRGKDIERNFRIIYFDLDGCLARWKSVPVEETHEKGYFADLEPEPELLLLVRVMQRAGFDVRICSKYYCTSGTETEYAFEDKMNWLQKVGLSDIPAVLVPYDENKFDYIEKGSVLVSDYSKELFECVENGIFGIKFFNGCNGTKGSWGSLPSINKDQTAKEMYHALLPYLKAVC